MDLSTVYATASSDGTAAIWNAETHELIIRLPDHGLQVREAQLTPDGTRVATTTPDGQLRIWDAASGRLLMLMTTPHRDRVRISFSRDGTQLIVSGSLEPAIILDAISRRERMLR